MVEDPSVALKNPFTHRGSIELEALAIFDARRNDRNMALIEPLTRVLRKGEIHELVVTDEMGAQPGAAVNSVAYLAFAVITRAGVIRVGDRLVSGAETIGRIVGYDETHMPNHMNIVFYAEKAKTGAEMSLTIGNSLTLLP